MKSRENGRTTFNKPGHPWESASICGQFQIQPLLITRNPCRPSPPLPAQSITFPTRNHPSSAMIRIPSVPGLQPTNVSMPKVDPTAKIQQLQSLGPIAQGIASLGEAFHDHAAKVQKMADDATITEARNKLATEWQQESHRLQESGDPSTYVSGAVAFFQKKKADFDALSVTDESRRTMDGMFDQDATRAKLDMGEMSYRQTRANLDSSTQNQIKQAYDSLNESALRTAYAPRIQHGLSTQTDLDTAVNQLNRAKKYQNEVVQVLNDPFDWFERNPKPPENPEDRDTWFKLYDIATSLSRQQAADTYNYNLDRIKKREINNPEQIDNILAPSLTPSAREDLKQKLLYFQTSSERARIASPEVQKEKIGQLDTLLKSFNPADPNNLTAEKINQMQFIAADLNKGSPAEKYYSEKINSAIEGAHKITSTKEDFIISIANDIDKTGALGRMDLPKPIPIKQVLDSGFLRDRSILSQLPLTQEQVESIIAPRGYREINGQKIPANTSDEERANLLRGFLDPSKIQSNIPFDIKQKVAAIKEGKSEVDLSTPEQVDLITSRNLTADRIKGDAIMYGLAYLRQYPDSDLNKIQDEMVKNVHNILRRTRLENSFNPSSTPSTRSSYAPQNWQDLTSMVKDLKSSDGLKLTAYRDYRQDSIGYGTKAKSPHERITPQEAESRLKEELDIHKKRVLTANDKYNLQLTSNQIDALTSFDFNTGDLEPLLDGGRRTKAQIAEAMILYRNAGGQQRPELEASRRAEQSLFLNGYPK
jgi:GH24 family phage-related lysozyme (muramidase)